MERIGPVLRARLDCGLTVLMKENHHAPVVAAQIWVDVGSADEKPGEEGLAHLHEHMLFKGTKTRGVSEIAKAVEAAGGDINAWTSFDNTAYHVVLSSRHLDLGLEVLADAVQNANRMIESMMAVDLLMSRTSRGTVCHSRIRNLTEFSEERRLRRGDATKDSWCPSLC